MTEKYYELAEYRASNRNRLILAENISHAILEKGADRPLFRSVFWYTEDIVDYLKTNKSVSSYRGIRGIDSIPIDIDKGSNSDTYTKEKLLKFLDKLEEIGLDDQAYQIYFSGTGFHIFIDNSAFDFQPSTYLPEQVSQTLYNIGLIDDSSIIRGNQLIRLENSLNEKSNLYKIPLSIEEVRTLSLDQIRELARSQRLDFVVEEKNGRGILEKFVVPSFEFDSGDKIIPSSWKKGGRVDEGKFDNRYAICIQKLYELGPREGSRNNTVMRIASHCKRQGMPEDFTIAGLLFWNSKTNQSLDDRVIIDKVHQVYNKPYRYGCNDIIMKEFCNPNCLFYKHKNLDKTGLLNVSDLDRAFEERLQIIENKDRYINLKNIFGLDVDCVLYPGELVVFQGDTGINKTSIIQNIMLGVDMVNDLVRPPELQIIYYGPELSAGVIQLRNYCIVTGYTEDEVIKHKDELYKYHTALEHIAVQTGILTIEGIEQLILDYQPQVLVIDYYEQVEHPAWNRSPTMAIAEISKSLSVMAQKYNIILIAISQVNRASAVNKDVGIHSGFGSGAVEKTARRLFTITGEQDSPYRIINHVKANSDVLWKNVILERQDNWRFRRIK